MDGFLWTGETEALLSAELRAAFPGRRVNSRHGALWIDKSDVRSDSAAPLLAFARQYLPNAQWVSAPSVKAWVREACARLEAAACAGPWFLHVAPHYTGAAGPARSSGARAFHTATRYGGSVARAPERAAPQGPAPGAGERRCELIREGIRESLHQRNRALLARWVDEPRQFEEGDSVLQVLLTTPELGCISWAQAPVPLENRHILSPFPKGHAPVPADKSAPSRAFAKLVEAGKRLGCPIAPGERCVDLGASPGSWTHAAAQRGALVTAVDRSPLRADLMNHPRVRFQMGDAFAFAPAHPVDWLLCDVIAAPERLGQLLTTWLERGWCRRFVVTVKLKWAGETEVLAQIAPLKEHLPPLCSRLMLTRLETNKHEICAYGVARRCPPPEAKNLAGAAAGWAPAPFPSHRGSAVARLDRRFGKSLRLPP